MDFTGVARFGLLLVRPGMLLASAPVFGTFAPPFVRVGLIVLVTLALAPVVAMPAAGEGLGLSLVAAREMMIGLSLGLSVRILVAAAELAGHLAGFQIGFAYASLVDPQSGARNGVISALYANLTVIVFLGLNGHHQMLQALAASYTALPLGGAGGTGNLAGLVARSLGTVFVIGVRLAAPVVLVLVLVEVMLGLLARAAPQLNLMITAAPIRLFVGLVILGTTVAVVPDVVAGSIGVVLTLAARLAAAVAG
jgi:flagellar biosynthetic protein FliR